MAGVGEIGDIQGAMGYMNAMGVPGILAYPTIAALAAFSVITALLFHHNFADKMQMTTLMKDISMAGSLLLLSTYTNK